MRIICTDYSTNKESVRRTRRILATCLIRLTSRVYTGDLPLRVIKELILALKVKASKSTAVLILVGKNEGYHGWTSFKIGSNKSINSRVYFPDDNKLVSMHNWENIPEWKKIALKFKRLEEEENYS